MTKGRSKGGATIAHTKGLPGERQAPFARMGYGTVVLFIAIAYALCASQATPQSTTFTLLLQLVTVGLIFRVAKVGKILRRITYIVVGVAVILAMVTWVLGVKGHGLDLALSVTAMASYFVSPAVIIRQQLKRTSIDAQTLLAAIAAYLLIGMFFAFVYNLLGLITPSGIFGAPENNTLSSQLFFSFTTLTTTGFGNVVPVTPLGQSTAIAEAISGQLFLIVAVARVVSGMVPSKKREATEGRTSDGTRASESQT